MATLLTGGTGFLGGALLAGALSRPRADRWIALVRAGDDDAARRRIERSLRRFGVDAAEAGPRLSVVAGDLEDPASLERLDLLDDVTHVAHLAANTSFRSRAGVWRVNVDGSLHLARRLSRARRLRRFLYVGTATICGDRPGPLVREQDHPSPGVRHLVGYTESKAAAELALARAGVPLVVARPSIVVGHTRLGCGPSGSLFWAFRAVDALRMVTWSESARIDVVPVDWAADALLALLDADALAHDAYHVSAGPRSAVRWRDIHDAFARARGLDPGPFYERIEPGSLAARVGELGPAFGPCDRGHVVGALELYFRFAELDAVFDDARLAGLGVVPPPSFPSWLETCLRTSPMPIAQQMKDDE